MKGGPEMPMPKDLDPTARKKWRELIETVDPETDAELVANYARMYGSLMAIRSEKARQIKARTFETTVPGREGSMQLNPLITAENRMVSSLNRMLRTLGLAPSREEQGRRPHKLPTEPPPGMEGPEPNYGWPIAIALCRGLPNPTPENLQLEKQWDEWLAAHGMPLSFSTDFREKGKHGRAS
jgi:phage terminase small subunit